MVVEEDEELLVAHDLLLPWARSTGWSWSKVCAGECQAVPVDVLEVGGPADGGLLALGAAADPVDDPLQDAHVLASSRARGTCRRRPCGTS